MTSLSRDLDALKEIRKWMDILLKDDDLRNKSKQTLEATLNLWIMKAEILANSQPGPTLFELRQVVKLIGNPRGQKFKDERAKILDLIELIQHDLNIGIVNNNNRH